MRRAACSLVAWLASDRRDATLVASARGMGVVIDGAREHGLPADYVTWLGKVPVGESLGVACAFRPLVDAVMRLRRSWRRRSGRARRHFVTGVQS